MSDQHQYEINGSTAYQPSTGNFYSHQDGDSTNYKIDGTGSVYEINVNEGALGGPSIPQYGYGEQYPTK